MNNIKCGCNMCHCHYKCWNSHNHCHHHRCSSLQPNFAGMQGNLNFQLYRLKGCKIEVYIECAGQEHKIMGKICNIGTDFLNIRVNEGQPGEKVVTVMTERICLIEWPDKHCNPCKDWKSCDSCNPCE